MNLTSIIFELNHSLWDARPWLWDARPYVSTMDAPYRCVFPHNYELWIDFYFTVDFEYSDIFIIFTNDKQKRIWHRRGIWRCRRESFRLQQKKRCD